MSDIRIDIPEDRTRLILKRIQNKISGYKGYSEGVDVRIPTHALYDNLKKRASVSLTNIEAATSNLEMYDKNEAAKKVREVHAQIEELGKLEISMPTEPVPVAPDKINELYLSDEMGFRNSIDLLDNINSFRSASISGEFDEDVMSKIVENIKNLKRYVSERDAFLNPKP